MIILFLRTLIFYIVLSLCMKLMGKRQIGELQMMEFVVAMMLSDIAVLPITDCDIPLLHGLIPVVVISSLEVIVTFSCVKSPKIRMILEGKPLILMYKGTVCEKNLTKARVTLDELLAEVRAKGYSDINKIQYIIFEQSGKLSVIPKAAENNATAADVGKSPEENGIAHAVIIDGRINDNALRAANRSREWLESKLKKTQLDKILYMTVDDMGKTTVRQKSFSNEKHKAHRKGKKP